MRYKLVHCFFPLLLLLIAASASADAAPRQLSVLRAGDAALDDPRTSAVDAALDDALRTRLADTAVQTSSAPLEDVQLIAGCGDDEAACLQLIANQLGSDALLVRRLSAESEGTAMLSLTTFRLYADGSAPRTRQLSTNIDGTDAQALQRAVVLVLAELELIPAEPAPVIAEPAAPPEPAPLPAHRAAGARKRWPARLGWTLSAVGCGLLGAGLISGVLSRRDERRYGRVTIDGPEAVDDAHGYLSSARQHAHTANGLFIGGAVLATAGVATTLWHWAAVRGDRGSAELAVQSTRSGLMLVLNGTWQGGSQ